MLFNSFDFGVFLPIVFLLYWFVFNRLNLAVRNIFLLTVSYIFYGFWDARFLILIFVSSLLDYFLAIGIDNSENPQKRKFLLIISLVTNLGILGFFKYCNFFVESFVEIFSIFGKELAYRPLSIILPVGISFYTFQSLSYTIDVYYKKFTPTKKVINFLAFVSFFPQLVAGPIERARDLLPQFGEKKTFNYEEGKRGFFLIIFGLFKKIVIADRLAIFVDSAYGNIEEARGVSLIIAVIFFAFQLYIDFSAYSDIAIGTAKLLGFKLSVNFRRPYLSTSFSEFWKRWHISLSSWFRDYVYIPLGGNRKGKTRQIFNVMVVFLLSGLWHGSSWNFVIWGALNGFFVIAFDKIFKLHNSKGIKKTIAPFLVFSCWALSCIFFRLPTFHESIEVFKNLGFSGDIIYNFGLNKPEFTFSIFLIFTLMIYEIVVEKWEEKLTNLFYSGNIIFRFLVCLLLIFTIIYLGSYGTANDNSFIYFQF